MNRKCRFTRKKTHELGREHPLEMVRMKRQIPSIGKRTDEEEECFFM